MPRPTDAQLVRRAARLGEPEAGLAAIAELRRRLDTLEAAHVERAVRSGWSWARVADALGITKQAAHARHAARTRRTGDGLVVAGRARAAVQRARAEATALGADRIGHEHLLLGLLAEGEDHAAATALRTLGVTRGSLLAHLPEPAPRASRARPPQPAREAREVLEQSLREAVARGDERLDVEHLLLALLRDPGGRARALLAAHGRSPRAVARELNRALAQASSSSSSSS